ncbi:hypothetical protein ACU4GD_05710 [Cupriavidus basilensis]
MLGLGCDLIVASDDAFFADPVVRMGIPGCRVLRARLRAQPAHRQGILFMGERMDAQRACQDGCVVNLRGAARGAGGPPRRACGQDRADATAGLEPHQAGHQSRGRTAGQARRHGMPRLLWHHFAHAHNELVSGDKLGGFDARAMAACNRTGEEKAA